MQLTPSQAKALAALTSAISSGPPRLLSLAGSAGTGKTTLIKALREALIADSRDVVVATPTNKAAQVLDKKGIPANTFYKTFFVLDTEAADLGIDTDEEPSKQRPRRPLGDRVLSFTSCRDRVNAGVASGQNEQQLLDRLESAGKRVHCEILIIDEASMLARRRIVEMQKMCDTLILVGDHHQLPPVGDREYPAGFFAELKHTAVLTEIMRQSEGSLILDLADELRRAGPLVEKKVRYFEPQDSFAELIKHGFQCIAFTNKERQRINTTCRKILGFRTPLPEIGDRMLVTNNYSTDLLNGTEVEIVDFNWDGHSPSADIELLQSGRVKSYRMSIRSFAKDQIASVKDSVMDAIPSDVTAAEAEENLLELTWAYCMTAHKAQGSEWPGVIVFDQRRLIQQIQERDTAGNLPPSEYVRRWLYTAITRARQTLHIAPTWFAKTY